MYLIKLSFLKDSSGTNYVLNEDDDLGQYGP